MKVSIIIPAYNAEKYITRCLDSLSNQSLKEIEIIIINDGSTDQTEKICKEYQKKDSRIIVLSKNNEGQGIARNFGIHYAKGEYIGFVDADDYVELDMYETLYNAAKTYDADLVYSYMEGESFIDSNEFRAISNGVEISKDKIKYFQKLWLGGMPNDKEDSILGMSVCRSIFRRNIIVENEIQFISERIVNTEDLLFNLEYSGYCNKIVTVNSFFYSYCHDNPMSFAVKPNPNRFSMFCELYHRMLEICRDNEEQLRTTRRFLANCRIIMVEKARWCTLKNFGSTRREMLRILNNELLQDTLADYPVKYLPFMQRTYFLLMKYKFAILLIVFAKLRYSLL